MSDIKSIKVESLELVGTKPLILSVDTGKMDTITWCKENKNDIEGIIQNNGAVLIRGLNRLNNKQFGEALKTIFADELINYNYRSTPRTELEEHVYTATEYHSDQVIAQHNENSYSNQWAMRLGFLCKLPSETGGETPIADSRIIYQKIPKEIRDEFEAKKIMYVRNYSDLDLPWSEVFQTENRVTVDKYCRRNNISFEWLEGNALRTKQTTNASQVHPATFEKVWFNQAHLFHVSNLDEELRKCLLDILPPDELPRNTYFGDGSEIDTEFLNIIRSIYEAEKVTFDWQRDDLLLLDNMLYTHGREKFSGSREVLVGMAKPCKLEGG